MKIELAAPARWITQETHQKFQATLPVAVGAAPAVFEQAGQLAGADGARTAALAAAFEEADVVWSVRGGYGAMRLLPLLQAPGRQAMFIGYSDACALQFGALGGNAICIHGAMPIDLMREVPGDARKSVLAAYAVAGQFISDGQARARHEVIEPLRAGAISAPVYACNLAVLCALLGTRYAPDLPDHILCLEDVGEYKYAVDRLFWQLAQSTVAAQVKGLVLGDFTDLEDNEVPWGQSVAEMAVHHFPDIPMATGLPIGHGGRNLPIIQGETGTLEITGTAAQLTLSGQRAQSS